MKRPFFSVSRRRAITLAGVAAATLLGSLGSAIGIAHVDPPTTTPTTQPRSPDAVVAELEATPMPIFDESRRGDKTYSSAHSKSMGQAMRRRLDLISELYSVEPNSPRTRVLLVEHWRLLGQYGRGSEAIPEIQHYFADSQIGPEREQAAYYGAFLEIGDATSDQARMLALANYQQRSGDRARLSELQMAAADRMAEVANKVLVLRQVAAASPGTPEAESALGKIKQLDSIGKPFELAFKDAITGQDVSIAGLKGKVIVIDFWATWCGPCRKSIPELRSLYAELHDQGMEMISVSLDSAGEDNLEKVKKAVAQEQMPWFQYYQGDGFNSTFSNSWGINFIPQMFVIDRQGNLASAEARKDLRNIVRSLLKAQ